MDADEKSLLAHRTGSKHDIAWLLLVAPPPLLQASIESSSRRRCDSPAAKMRAVPILARTIATTLPE
jgi:hypothetical protein